MPKINSQAIYEAMLNADLRFNHYEQEYAQLLEEHTLRFISLGKTRFDAEWAASKVPQVESAAKKAIWNRAKASEKAAVLQALFIMRLARSSIPDKDFRALGNKGVMEP